MENIEIIREGLSKKICFSEAKRIEKGFSFEEKYLLKGENGRNYLLRITQLSEKISAERKNEEFEIIKKLRQRSSLVPKAHFFGVSDDESLCYMVLDYITGKDGEEALAALSSDEQYSLGIEAGKELLKLHSLDAPPDLPGWYERQSQKYASYCSRYDELKLKNPIVDMDRVFGFISANISSMRCERQSFQHDDYHPANLIVDGGRLCGIIDFNRHDWGDPVYDFVKTAYFSSAISIQFARGQIDGYSDGEVPVEFWMKYSLYSAMAVVSDIVWSHWYSKEAGDAFEVERMRERVKRVYLDHDCFDSEIPRWYRE
ncbi:MAG: aminoglycoside phosphotransferase family protein [Methanomicrobiaceae archaeon]|nr:aminoglycoside phosphotransferase family protein [Methanomicrobiaceae archaeon]